MKPKGWEAVIEAIGLTSSSYLTLTDYTTKLFKEILIRPYPLPSSIGYQNNNVSSIQSISSWSTSSGFGTISPSCAP